MSKERENLLRRLEETQQRLESAHTDYLAANTATQQALGRVLDAFGDLADTVRVLVAESDLQGKGEPEKEARRDVEIEEIVDIDSQGETIEAQTPSPPQKPRLPTPPTSPVADDQQDNALPARLHSRGISLPQKRNGDEQEPGRKEEPRPAPSRYRSLRLEQPVLVESPAEGIPHPALQKDRKIVLTNDGFGVAPILNDLLAAQGFRVRTESRRPELTSPVDTVIFLGSLRAPANLDDAMSVVDDAMYAAEKMTTRLMQPGSGFIAAVDTAGCFGLDDFDPVAAPFGALLGLIRLLDGRHPGANTKLIDLDGGRLQARQIAEALIEELLRGGTQTPVAVGRERRGVEWVEFQSQSRPAPWLEEENAPLVYMPGPKSVLATAVERLAIAHELPVAVLRRRGVSAKLIHHFDQRGIRVRSADYDLNGLFAVMDFFDRMRADFGPIAAIVAESFPVQKRDDMARWDVARPALDEFNALLAMTINDPLRLLGVGLSPHTPPVVSSAMRYFARAESLRRNEELHIRLAHLDTKTSRQHSDLAPADFALTEFLSAADPAIAEMRFAGK